MGKFNPSDKAAGDAGIRRGLFYRLPRPCSLRQLPSSCKLRLFAVSLRHMFSAWIGGLKAGVLATGAFVFFH